jgi:hypothetical protein
MAVPILPRPREAPIGERLDELLRQPPGRVPKEAARNLSASAARLAAGDHSPTALLAEAALLESAGLKRVRALAEESEQAFQRYRPDSFNEGFLPPADAVNGVYYRLVKADSMFDNYVEDSQLPTLGGWYQECPELVRAGELRLEAYQGRDYPTSLCPCCHRLGWTSASGRCDYCLWAAKAVGLMAKGGLFRWDEREACLALCARYDHAAAVEYRDVRRGAGLGLFWPFQRKRYAVERLAAWGKVVHEISSSFGPAEPEDGYELWIPERFELEALDGSAILVHFRATRYRWQLDGFLRLATKLRQAEIEPPNCFSATLAPAALASAWYDFRVAIDTVNADEWQARLGREADSRAAFETEQERQDMLARQRGTAAILEA